MDASVLTLLSSLALSVITGITTVAVAALNSRKTQAQAHEELAITENALKRELGTLAAMLEDCRRQHIETCAEVSRQHVINAELTRNMDALARKLDNVRAGKESTWVPFPET